MVQAFTLPTRRKSIALTSSGALPGADDGMGGDAGQPGVNGTKTDGGVDGADLNADGGVRNAQEEDIQELVKNDRWLLDTAMKMRDSGDLRIKPHKKGFSTYPDTFKGEYAVEWMIKSGIVKDLDDALFLGDKMMKAGLMRHIQMMPYFHASSDLYTFTFHLESADAPVARKDISEVQHIANQLSVLRRSVRDMESRLNAHSTQHEAHEHVKFVAMQLEFRVGVAERHVASVETALSTLLHVQQLSLCALLLLLLLHWAPAAAAAALRALVGALLVLLALRSRALVGEFALPKVDYAALADSVAASFKVPGGSMRLCDSLSASLDIAESPRPGRTPSTDQAPLLSAPSNTLTAQSAPGAISTALSLAHKAVGQALDMLPPLRRLSQGGGCFAESPPPRVQEPWNRLTNDDSERSNAAPNLRLDRSAPAGTLGRRSTALESPSQKDYLRRETWSGLGSSQPPNLQRDASVTSDFTGSQHSTAAQPVDSLNLDTFEKADTDPVIVKQAHLPGHTYETPTSHLRVNTGQPHDFETPAFSGKIVMWIRGCPMAQRYKEMFKDRRRQSWIAVQGRFKRPIPMSEVYTGQHLLRPAKNLPAMWFLNTFFLRIARSLAPSAHIGSLSQPPSMLFPLITLAQFICVSRPGEEPDILNPPLEDLRLIVPELAEKYGRPAPPSKRKAYFENAERRKAHVFDTEHVYTFHVWQHAVDLSTYKLTIFRQPSLVQYLDGQPLSFMARTGTGDPAEYLWKFDVWHRALLPEHEEYERRRKAAAAPVLQRTSAPTRTFSPPMRDRAATAPLSSSSFMDDLPPRQLRNEPSLAHQLVDAGQRRATQGVTWRMSSDSVGSTPSGTVEVNSMVSSARDLVPVALSPDVNNGNDRAMSTVALPFVLPNGTSKNVSLSHRGSAASTPRMKSPRARTVNGQPSQLQMGDNLSPRQRANLGALAGPEASAASENSTNRALDFGTMAREAHSAPNIFQALADDGEVSLDDDEAPVVRRNSLTFRVPKSEGDPADSAALGAQSDLEATHSICSSTNLNAYEGSSQRSGTSTTSSAPAGKPAKRSRKKAFLSNVFGKKK